MKLSILALFSILLLLIESCSGKTENHRSIEISERKELVSGAERFKLQKYENYSELTIINPWQGARNVFQVYYLVKKGDPIPDGIDSSKVIHVPVKSIVCMSTTYVSMIAALNEENSISGVSGKSYIYSDLIKENIDLGLIGDVGFEANLNKELIIKISPDLIMMYGIDSESSGYIGKIRELGVRVLYNADYLETDPLSKAEWIKVFGALYCKENMADSIFISESISYNTLKSYIKTNISDRPKVLLGLPFKDTWYVSPGNSFICKLISDAGGEYLWKDVQSAVSMPFGIENVFLQAVNADFWLNIGNVTSKEEISVFDQRLLTLPCVKQGNLFNNNKRVTSDGGNDYWESGSLYPHIILKDIASILHPGLFNDYELIFYRKLY